MSYVEPAPGAGAAPASGSGLGFTRRILPNGLAVFAAAKGFAVENEPGAVLPPLSPTVTHRFACLSKRITPPMCCDDDGAENCRITLADAMSSVFPVTV